MKRLEELFGLHGKIALVTGGGRGIGRMIASAFLDAGAERVYIASRDSATLAQTADELSADGRCRALPADLSSEAGCKALAQALASLEPRLHILVNNSGATWMAPFEDFPADRWDRLFELNLKAPFFLSRALNPLLSAAATDEDPARILNIGSIAGEMAESMQCYAYGLSKGGLHHLSRMLAKELGSRGIAVNAIAPGRFATRMTKAVGEDEARYQRELAMIPLGRWGRDDDIAGLALMLASRAGAGLTGAVIPLDGGASLVTG